MLARSDGVGATATGGGVWLETAGSRGGHGAGGDTEWITITQRGRANQRGFEIIFLIFTARETTFTIGVAVNKKNAIYNSLIPIRHATNPPPPPRSPRENLRSASLREAIRRRPPAHDSKKRAKRNEKLQLS